MTRIIEWTTVLVNVLKYTGLNLFLSKPGKKYPGNVPVQFLYNEGAEGTVRYATQYGGVFSTCVRQSPLSKLKAKVIIILILINNLKQVKL